MKILLFNHPLLGKSEVKLLFFLLSLKIFLFIKRFLVTHGRSDLKTWPGPRAEKPTKPPYVSWKNHQIGVKCALNHQYGRRDVTCKPAILTPVCCFYIFEDLRIKVNQWLS